MQKQPKNPFLLSKSEPARHVPSPLGPPRNFIFFVEAL